MTFKSADGFLESVVVVGVILWIVVGGVVGGVSLERSTYDVSDLDPHEEYTISSATTTQELAILINYYSSISSANQTFIENLSNSGYTAEDAAMASAIIYQKETETKLAKVRLSYNALLAEVQLDELKDTSDTLVPELDSEIEHDFEDEYFDSEENLDWVEEETFENDEAVLNTDKYMQYPSAYTVWLYLTEDMNLNDFVSAGILGNMMAECGGQTLDLQVSIYGGSGLYYGVCQWHSTYYPAVQGTDLETQLDFLKSNIEQEFNMFGGNYESNFKYEDFTNLTSSAEAALAFAKAYERCGSSSLDKRVANAQTAYDFFTS